MTQNLTLIDMSYESKKIAHLSSHLGTFFIRLNELGINVIDVNFHPKKSFESFAAKNLIKKGQGVESALPHAN